jgi:alkaline phosphatase
VLDSNNPDRLLTMTKVAIDHLENDQGYVLLIEASQIDWAGHGNDIAAAMGEMQDLATTLIWLKSYVESRDDTLLVVTADHSTGGLTLAANSEYRWQPEVLHNVQGSSESITRKIIKQDQALLASELKQLFGFELSQEELDTLKDKSDKKKLYQQINKIIDNRTNTGWTTGGHTGIDVQVFATGVGAQAFAGQLTNTDIATKIFSILAK